MIMMDQMSEDVMFEAAGAQSFQLWLSKKQRFCMKSADPKKKTPPKLQIVTAGTRQPGLKALLLKTKVPTKYIKAPRPANRSTQKPLSSYSIASVTLFYFCLTTLQIFQLWAIIMTADPTMNSQLPSQAKSSTGMNRYDPTRQSVDPSTEMRKLMESQRCGQLRLVQCSHSVISARRKVNDPMVYSQADTQAAVKNQSKMGKSASDPKRKVLPPTKQLKACQFRQSLEFYTVDFTYIQYYRGQRSKFQRSWFRFFRFDRIVDHVIFELSPFLLIPDLLSIIIFGFPLAFADLRSPSQHFQCFFGNRYDFAGRFRDYVETQTFRQVFFGKEVS